MSIAFEFLPHNGESIVVRTPELCILIDGGCENPFYNPFSQTTSEKDIDIIIVTHVDYDHIEGIIQLLENSRLPKLKKIIFNEPLGSNLFIKPRKSNLTSYQQGNKLAEIIEDYKLSKVEHLNDICIENTPELQLSSNTSLKILSPSKKTLEKLHQKWSDDLYNKESNLTSRTEKAPQKSTSIEEISALPFIKDKSLPNKSSLAFILKIQNEDFLFLGDAHIDQVTSGLESFGFSETNPLEVNFISLFKV